MNNQVQTGGTGRSELWRGNAVKPLYATRRSAYSEQIRPSARVVHMTDEQRGRQDLQVQWLKEAIKAQARMHQAPMDLKSLSIPTPESRKAKEASACES